MMSASSYHSRSLTVDSRGRSTIEITRDIQKTVAESGIANGLCNIFVHHTSASLIICENADPAVRTDLERFIARLIPDGDRIFEHTSEGADDMPAHVRAVLTQTSLTVPVEGGRCSLGTWQGVYLWEHRYAGHRRRLTISVLGGA